MYYTKTFQFILKMRRFPNKALHYATLRQSASPGTAGDCARFDSLRPSQQFFSCVGTGLDFLC